MNLLRAFAGKAAPKPDYRQQWLLAYNCQATGLGNCLNLMSDAINVEYYDPVDFRKHAKKLQERMASFDRVLVAPQFEHSLGVDFSQCAEVWRIPTIAFSAYHPDICYLSADNKPLKGPLGDYHSLIAYAAFRVGLDPQHAAALYREEIYAALGYLGRWDRIRDRLLESFREHGLDISEAFVNWSRGEPFMYSLNHPRIHCLRDLAQCILTRAGLESSYRSALPHDNMANGPIYPVFPEIGARLGVDGNYLFKVGGKYQFLRLEAFITASFELYRTHRSVSVAPGFTRQLERALRVVENAR